MRTQIYFTNSNGSEKQIDTKEAAMLLGMYPLGYYSPVGYQFGTSQDYRGGHLMHVVACKLDDGTSKGSWLAAEHGSKATARKTLAAWQALISSKA